MKSKSKDKVAVVILNWNGLKHLQQFLPKVIQYSENNAKIVVIDNASSDNSAKFINNNFKAVELIQLDRNYGFAQGYNEGLKKIDAEYCILLNSDVEVTENWINPIVELMEQDNTIGACQPKIKDYKNRSYFEYAGAAGGFIDKYGYPFCRGRMFNLLEKDNNQFDDVTEVFWATGACMFVRKNAFVEAGGFDTNYFAHMEEIDLCWRLKNKGFKIMYYGASTVYHLGGGTLHKSNPKKTFLNFRNNLLTLYKNLPDNKVNRIILLRLLLDGIAGLKFLLDGNYKDTIAILKAHFSFYGMKKQYKNAGVKTYPSRVYHGNIVTDFYLNGKKKFTDLNF